MTVLTIDSLGRVMLPEGIRQTLGLNPEDQLTLEIQDGKIVLQPVPHKPRVYYEGKVLVVQSEFTGPVDAVDPLREERIQEQTSW